MCETAGRRCPCDTSAARQQRRVNAGARTDYVGLVSKPQTPNFLTVEAEPEQNSVAGCRKLVAEIRALDEYETENSGTIEQRLEYDRLLNVLGAGINHIAETKYGAPTDEDFTKAIADDEERVTAAALVDADKQELAKIAEAEALEKLYETGIDRDSHPIMRERFLLWEVNHPELYRAWKNKQIAREALASVIYDKRRNGEYEKLRTSPELYVKRNEGIKAALAEVGVQFADPETLKFAENSHAGAVKSVKEALTYYPQEWIDNSNAEMDRRHPLRIKNSTGRAHYQSYAIQKTMQTKTIAFLEEKPEDWTPNPLDPDENGYVATNENGDWVDPKSGIIHEGNGTPGYKSWARVSYERSRNETKPRGNSWESYQVYEQHYNSAERRMERTGEIVTRWRRPNVRKRVSSEWGTAELTVSKEKTNAVSKDAGFRVAMHEFAHRVEHTTPSIKLRQDVFLRRRAGIYDPNQEDPKLETINGIRGEVGYKDNFPEHYMGKVYTTGHREILSMGMETLFGGSNGGFVGDKGYKADADYKRFLLGLLATTAKPSQD